jgi:hypothetical protein
MSASTGTHRTERGFVGSVQSVGPILMKDEYRGTPSPQTWHYAYRVHPLSLPVLAVARWWMSYLTPSRGRRPSNTFAYVKRWSSASIQLVGGQVDSTNATMSRVGTGPKMRESDELGRLSPITKRCPAGTSC